MPKFDVSGPWPFDRELTMTYDMVDAPTALLALLTVHRDALGKHKVKLRDGQIVFTDAEDLWMCAGVWKVFRVGWNGPNGSCQIVILPDSALDRVTQPAYSFGNDLAQQPHATATLEATEGCADCR